MRKQLFAGNGNPPPKDKPMREAPMPVDDGEMSPQDAGNGNPPPPDKPINPANP